MVGSLSLEVSGSKIFSLLDGCSLSPEKSQHGCCHPELHKKRIHLTYIYRTYMKTFEQEEEKHRWS